MHTSGPGPAKGRGGGAIDFNFALNVDWELMC